MLSTAPSGPRSPARTWLAAVTIIGLRIAVPSLARCGLPAARPGLWTRFVAARASISPSLGTRRRLQPGRERQHVTLRVAVEHEHEQLGPGGAVDRGVVDLREDAEPIVRQALEDIGLPERPAPIEGRPTILATISAIWSSRPGGGTPLWRTWKSRSKSGSSIQ